MSQDLFHLDRYARQGDAQAFDTLVRTYQGLVYSVCLRHLGDETDAQDATQETFLTLARKARSVRSNLAGWLHSCARQISLDMLRKQIAQRKRDTESARARTDAQHDPSASWSEVRLRLDEALAELDEPTRQLLVERFFVGRTQQDLATDAGVSQSLMSRRIGDAVDRLRSMMVSKGVAVPAAVLAAGLAAESAQAATVPAALTASLSSIGLSGVAAGSATPSSNIVVLGVTMNVKAFAAGVVLAATSLGGGATYFVAQQYASAAGACPAARAHAARMAQAKAESEAQAEAQPLAVAQVQPAAEGVDESLPLDKRWPELGFAKVVELKPGTTDMNHSMTRNSYTAAMTIADALVQHAGFENRTMSSRRVIDESGKKLLDHPSRFIWNAPAGHPLSEHLPTALRQVGVILLRSIQLHFKVQVVYEKRPVEVLLMKVGADGGAALKARRVTNLEGAKDAVRGWSDWAKRTTASQPKQLLMNADAIASNVENAYPTPVINDTGLPDENYGVEMPKVEELAAAGSFEAYLLKKYGLKLEPGTREIEVMVIKPAPAK